MNIRFYSFLITVLLAAPAQAREASDVGPGSGGGGGVVLCQNPDQSIKSAELIDFVESAFYDRTEFSAVVSSQPWERQIEIVTNRIAFVDPGFYTQLSVSLKQIKKNLDNAFSQTKDTEIVFPAPQDLSHGRVPPMRLGCQLIAAAVYNDAVPEPFQLTISHYIWRHLSEMHKAGLILHEAIYLTHRKIYRNLQKSRSESPDSSATRGLVGFLFSTELEQKSVTDSEREKFKQDPYYRGIDLPFGTHDPSLSFRNRIQFFMKPLLVHFVKDLERPLYLNEKSCSKPGGFWAKVNYKKLKGNEKPNCKLKVVGHLWPAKIENRISALKKWDANSKAATYDFHLGSSEVMEEVMLECPATRLDAYNPGFEIYCGQQSIAKVRGSDFSFTTTGLPMKLKKDSDLTVPFKFD